MRRIYQLLRHLVVARESCWPDGWRLEPHLLAAVNALNVNRDRRPHAAEFEVSWRVRRLLPEQMQLLSWQELLTRGLMGARLIRGEQRGREWVF